MFNEKIENLYGRINERLNAEEIESNDSFINIYDLNQMCIKQMNGLNKYFDESIKSKTKKLNFKYKFSNLFKESNNIYIYQVIPMIDEYNQPVIDIILANDKNRYCGELYVIGNEYRLENFDETRFKNKQNRDLILASYESFMELIPILNYFKSEYPNTSFKWDNQNPCETAVLDVEDDFLSCRINLNSPERTFLTLKSVDDILLATTHSKNHGKLFDYVEFYNEAFQRRLGVNVEDLNPMFKQIVEKSRKEDKELTLTKSN